MERRGGWKDYWLASDVLEFTSHGYDGHMFDGDMNKVEFKGYRADCMTDFALEYLRKREAGEIGIRRSHLFYSFHILNHITRTIATDMRRPEGSKERFKDYEVPGDLVDTEGDWRENYPDYLGCCWSLDYNLGRIREELEKLNLTENTGNFLY